MSWIASNAYGASPIYVPILNPTVINAATDVFVSNFALPPRVDWHNIPANLNVTRLSIAARAAVGSDVTVQPRLGGVAMGPSVTLQTGQRVVQGDVGLIVPPMTGAADLNVVKFGAFVSPTAADIFRFAWKMKFDAPFERTQLISTTFQSANNLGIQGSATINHLAPASFALSVQNTLRAVPWPMDGSFGNITVVTQTNQNVNQNPQLRIGLMINGSQALSVDTPVITSGNLVNVMLDDNNIAFVNQGDLVQFFATRIDGVGSQINSGTKVFISIGFTPD